MVNPDWSRESTKSILASFRYGMLIRSTTSLTPNCSSETSPSATSSSRYIAYRRPEQPPGWTATRSAMSARPSCSRSCLTLVAAISLRLIIGPFLTRNRSMDYTHMTPLSQPGCPATPSPSALFLEVGDLAARGAQQLVRGDREHRIGSPRGGPDHIVRQQITVDQDGQTP